MSDSPEDTLGNSPADPTSSKSAFEAAAKRQLPMVPHAKQPCSRGEVDGGLLNILRQQEEMAERIAELSANFNAAAELLIGDGTLALDEYEERRVLTGEREKKRAERDPVVILADEPDKYGLKDLPDVDCAAMMHICKAVCCKFEVALTVQDLDEGKLRWAYQRPYVLATGEDGHCVHRGEGGGCTVYEHRPTLCRTYDCREDPRIWKDFDEGILADPPPITKGVARG